PPAPEPGPGGRRRAGRHRAARTGLPVGTCTAPGAEGGLDVEDLPGRDVEVTLVAVRVPADVTPVLRPRPAAERRLLPRRRLRVRCAPVTVRHLTRRQKTHNI